MMRAVALLVVACGCRVAVSSGVDATTPSGDGLPERVVTDAALWADVRAFDRGAAPDRAPDVSGDVQPGGGDAGFGDGVPGQGCGLLVASCPGSEGCYPYPFESPSPAMTRCAFPGVGGPSIPCQSQLECDGTSLCVLPEEPDAICAQRCSLANPRCPTGFTCVPFLAHDGVGVCR